MMILQYNKKAQLSLTNLRDAV